MNQIMKCKKQIIMLIRKPLPEINLPAITLKIIDIDACIWCLYLYFHGQRLR